MKSHPPHHQSESKNTVVAGLTRKDKKCKMLGITDIDKHCAQICLMPPPSAFALEQKYALLANLSETLKGCTVRTRKHQLARSGQHFGSCHHRGPASNSHQARDGCPNCS